MATTLGIAAFVHTETCRADQIIVGSETYLGAKIVGLSDGRLKFRDASGELHEQWLHEVGLMIVDRGGLFADLNQAERFLAAGEPARAVTRYRRTLRLAEDFWPDLVAGRLTIACGQAGQIDQAVLNLIRTARGEYSGPPAAARLIPDIIPDVRDAKVMRAIGHLDDALVRGPPEALRTLFSLVRYEILRRSGDEGSALAADTAAGLSIPASIQSPRTYAIQLAALQATIEAAGLSTSIARLDRIMRDAPMTSLPPLLLLKGRVLFQHAKTREDWIRASWPMLRVAIHFDGSPQAPDGLLGAARAIEQTGRVQDAITLLEECLAHELVSEESRKAAKADLTRLAKVRP